MFKIFSIVDANNKFLVTYPAQESPREPGVFIVPENAIECEPTIPAADGKDRYYRNGAWEYEDIPPPEEPAIEPVAVTRFTSLEFLDRFTEVEQLAVVSATMSNPAIKLWYDRLLAASYVDLSDPRTEAGIDALIAADLIAPGRKQQLLEPQVA